ncbi:hypothetical protein A2Z33_05115 [Candidatus Gottesmanbacteria bacterium RBG_16_52_11]|uniref:NodB homology domain-containing protein n=1 Tax=Candidatus Gottesmanbacteria bacterium RBG_16_52_11 TaxID=1798374 RepID=A0A1F5YR90_9BACT|nr:MAG: hypothetical protein A2Z33_05115 [Candidatus Gottesmanbacteria bacterium RBG_16_52_11]
MFRKIISTLITTLAILFIGSSVYAQTATHVLYDDALRNSWVSWSWGSTVNFNDTSKPLAGTNNIRWTVNSGYAGLYLHKDGGVNTSGFSSVRFAVQSGQSGDELSVLAYGANDREIGPQLFLTNYGGNPVTGSYKQYAIPLADLGAANTQLYGFQIEDETGSSRPAIFVDSVELAGTGGIAPTPTPTPASGPTPTPTRTPTPARTPTPTRTPTPGITNTPVPTPVVSATPSPTPQPGNGFNRAVVSLTFDDASKTQYTNGWPVLSKYGFRATFYLTTGSLDGYWYMTPAMVVALANSGNHMGSHTINHPDLTTLTYNQVENQLSQPKNYLENLLGVAVNDFATPYGSYNAIVLSQIMRYNRSHRTVTSGYNTKNGMNFSLLKVQNVLRSTSATQITNWVNQAKSDRSWLILVYHEVKPSPSQWDVTSATLDSHLNALKNSGAAVVTVGQAIAEISPQL